ARSENTIVATDMCVNYKMALSRGLATTRGALKDSPYTALCLWAKRSGAYGRCL
ncbi:hypothetical protein BaRGS_00003780, partial [Batillaria attramentaria]